MAYVTGDEDSAGWSSVSAEAMAALDPEGDFVKKHLLNPTVFRMLGDVTGRRILDAGCGQGYFARLLAERGANVTALEPADGLFAYAAAREAERRQGIDLLQADLTDVRLGPVFDAVIANMVLLSIPDWVAALRTCVGALRPGGQLIFSITHPCFEDASEQWARNGRIEVREYFAAYTMQRSTTPDFHRPLSTYLNGVIAAGCRIAEVAEPVLPAALASQGAPAAEALVRIPGFVVIASTKD